MAARSFFIQVVNGGPDLTRKDIGLDHGVWSKVTTQLVSGTATLGSQAPVGVHSRVRSSMALRPCFAPVCK